MVLPDSQGHAHKAMLIQPLGRVLSWCPDLRLNVWVDDLKATACGRVQELAGHFPQVVAKLIGELKRAGLEASRGQPGKPGGKTKVVAGHRLLEEGMREPLSRLGVEVVQAMVYLGLDVQPRGRSCKVRQCQSLQNWPGGQRGFASTEPREEAWPEASG